jgi:S1-C subfamily serine protease
VNAKTFSALAVAAAMALPASGQTLEHAYRTNGPMMHQVVEPVRSVIQSCSAVISRGRKEVIYGTVVSADGYILTKASELGEIGGLSVTVGNREYKDPVRVSEDSTWDVALLKIDAEGLLPAPWAADLAEPERGTWVVSNGATTRQRRRVQIGIISATAREIPHSGGPVLGVAFEEKSGRLVVTEVSEKSGAAEAGIQKGDVLMRVAGEEIKEAVALSELLGKKRVGEEIDVVVRRKGGTIELKVLLKGRADVFGETLSRNDQMSGAFSKRRSGFPRVIQHDTVADATRMGGPLLDLEGRCLGMNIAWANRCESFAIPAAEARNIAERMIAAASE